MGSSGELRPAWHQVSGHRFEEGRQGALMSADGFFFKPVDLTDPRGRVEAGFYEARLITQEIRVAAEALRQGTSGPSNALAGFLPFVPECTGTVQPLGAEGGTFLRMRDLTADLSAPCVVDIKIGFTTVDPSLGEKYAAKCERKDRETTTATLGFRLGGMQVFERLSSVEDGTGSAELRATATDGGLGSDGLCLFRAPRAWCKALDAEGIYQALFRFFRGAGPGASDLLHGPGGVLSRLGDLTSWFEQQTSKAFFGASVLIIYDAAAADSCARLRSLKVKMVDFAHVLPAADKARDDNSSRGLRTLAAMLENPLVEGSHRLKLRPATAAAERN